MPSSAWYWSNSNQVALWFKTTLVCLLSTRLTWIPYNLSALCLFCRIRSRMLMTKLSDSLSITFEQSYSHLLWSLNQSLIIEMSNQIIVRHPNSLFIKQTIHWICTKMGKGGISDGWINSIWWIPPGAGSILQSALYRVTISIFKTMLTLSKSQRKRWKFVA